MIRNRAHTSCCRGGTTAQRIRRLAPFCGKLTEVFPSHGNSAGDRLAIVGQANAKAQFVVHCPSASYNPVMVIVKSLGMGMLIAASLLGLIAFAAGAGWLFLAPLALTATFFLPPRPR